MTVRRLSLLVFVACVGCGPKLPDDLAGLMQFMNCDDQDYHVNAANKVTEKYGKEGLLYVLREGQQKARSRAARWLWRFSGDDVEQALIEIVETETDHFLRIQALYSLAHIGTANAWASVEAATRDANGLVASTARETLAKIDSRVNSR